MKISDVKLNFVREPLKSPFGFKGGYLSELWQTAALVSSGEACGVGIGVQSVLWSDASVFAAHSQSAGNAYMYLLTEYALGLIKNTSFNHPAEVVGSIFDKVYEYAKTITNNRSLRKTFVLNALVPVDNAVWQLFGREQNCADFLALVPEDMKAPLCRQHDMLCNIPLITYNMGIDEITRLVRDGFFMLKIKIGADPDGDKSLDKMLAWDKKRLAEIHQAVSGFKTPYTKSGHVLYYLDANGRYDSKSRLEDFLSFADKIGALGRIVILEEPFDEGNTDDVSDISVRIAADESAHSGEDVKNRIELGYTAIALKPIAKTMSESLKMLKIAYAKGVPCFCADLTVNPVMVEWNKNIAARIDTLPELKTGVLESNGAQNYINWDVMKSYHPLNGRPFTVVKNGLFELDDCFYSTSGGIFMVSDYYKTVASS